VIRLMWVALPASVAMTRSVKPLLRGASPVSQHPQTAWLAGAAQPMPATSRASRAGRARSVLAQGAETVEYVMRASTRQVPSKKTYPQSARPTPGPARGPPERPISLVGFRERSTAFTEP
jgi:hypothetical protein